MLQLVKNMALFLVVGLPLLFLFRYLFDIEYQTGTIIAILVPYIVANAVSDSIFPIDKNRY